LRETSTLYGEKKLNLQSFDNLKVDGWKATTVQNPKSSQVFCSSCAMRNSTIFAGLSYLNEFTFESQK